MGVDADGDFRYDNKEIHGDYSVGRGKEEGRETEKTAFYFGKRDREERTPSPITNYRRLKREPYARLSPYEGNVREFMIPLVYYFIVLLFFSHAKQKIRRPI